MSTSWLCVRVRATQLLNWKSCFRRWCPGESAVVPHRWMRRNHDANLSTSAENLATSESSPSRFLSLSLNHSSPYLWFDSDFDSLILKLCPVQWSRWRGEKFESEIVICWRRALSRWQGEVIIRLALELDSTFFVKGSTYHDYRCRTCIPLTRYFIELEVVPVPCTRRERGKMANDAR